MARRNQPVKYCRYCGRIIRLDATDCPYCDRNVVKEAGRRECPFCGEHIRDKATKCKHCGEFLDRPASPAQPAVGNIVYIDKAIIAGRGAVEQGLELPEGDRRQVPQAEVPPDRRLVAPQSRDLQRRDGTPLPALPIPVVEPREEPAEPVGPGPPTPETPPAPPPHVQVKCPSCGSFVFDDDNFCENCGRDLSIPAGRSEFAAPPREYEPAHYALMAGAGAPVGLFLSSPFSLIVPAAAIALSLWCVLRIVGSRDPLLGFGRAMGGLAAGAFWLIVIAAFAS